MNDAERFRSWRFQHIRQCFSTPPNLPESRRAQDACPLRFNQGFRKQAEEATEQAAKAISEVTKETYACWFRKYSALRHFRCGKQQRKRFGHKIPRPHRRRNSGASRSRCNPVGPARRLRGMRSTSRRCRRYRRLFGSDRRSEGTGCLAFQINRLVRQMSEFGRFCCKSRK
jgi:hypothetical protein